MGPCKHLTASAALAGIEYLGCGSKQMALSCLASGVLVDADHLLEYADYCKKFHKNWVWSEFAGGTYFNKKKTVYVVFHSWELAIFVWVYCIVNKTHARKWVVGFASGYTLHLLLDQIGNNLGNKSYFWLYRWYCRWRQELLLQ